MRRPAREACSESRLASSHGNRHPQAPVVGRKLAGHPTESAANLAPTRFRDLLAPLLLSLLCATPSATALEVTDALLHQWPQWRGPLANGVAPHADPPTRWSETENVKWKVRVPGRGTASPIVWSNQVFLLTAVPTGAKSEPALSDAPEGLRQMTAAADEVQRFTVLAFDRDTGAVRWEHSPREQKPHAGHHRDHGYASASAITDGELLIAHFGSHGTYAYDLRGRLLWEKDLGDMRTRNSFGEGTSPALHGDLVVILWDHEGDDFLVALDKRTGQERWRQARDEPTGWTTPLVITHGSQAQAVLNGTRKISAYDLQTGRPLWEAPGQTQNPIPTPVAADGVVYVTSGYRGSALQAIRLDRSGDLTGTDAILWNHKRNTPYVPSPLLYDGLLYVFAGNTAKLTILEIPAGAPTVDGQEIEGLDGVYASPTGAANRVYLVGRNGGAVVLKKSPQLEVLARNRLDDGFDASPALADRQLFLRGRQHLYCLEEKK